MSKNSVKKSVWFWGFPGELRLLYGRGCDIIKKAAPGIWTGPAAGPPRERSRVCLFAPPRNLKERLMDPMKKLLALLLAMAMMVALVACGGNGGNNTAGNQTDDTTQNDTGNAGNDAQTDEGGEETTGGDAAAVTNADDIPDSMTSEDGKYPGCLRHRCGPAEGQELQPGYI